MNKKQRKEYIINLLNKKKFIKVSDIEKEEQE
jgi:hypothetical protein